MFKNEQNDIPKKPKTIIQLGSHVSFVLMILLLISVAPLIGYLFWPGHLLPGNVNVDLHLEGYEYRQEKTQSGIRRCLFAKVRVINRSGHPLSYRGTARSNPDRKTMQLVDNLWLGDTLITTPGSKFIFDDRETFIFYIFVRDKATAIKVEMKFGSSWFGETNHSVVSNVWQVINVD